MKPCNDSKCLCSQILRFRSGGLTLEQIGNKIAQAMRQVRFSLPCSHITFKSHYLMKKSLKLEDVQVCFFCLCFLFVCFGLFLELLLTPHCVQLMEKVTFHK